MHMGSGTWYKIFAYGAQYFHSIYSNSQVTKRISERIKYLFQLWLLKVLHRTGLFDIVINCGIVQLYNYSVFQVSFKLST